MSYIPSEYWLKYGRTYKEDFRYNKLFELQERILIEYMKHSISSSFSSVLEIGCGFGRITKLLLTNFPGISEYDALDISPEQIENARKLINDETAMFKAGPNLNFAVGDITSMQLHKKYDLVIAAEVLMHVLPVDIKDVIQKLVKSSNKHVVNIDWYEKQKPKKAAPHNFIHPYEIIYKELPEVKHISRVPIAKRDSWLRNIETKQSLFHAEIKN